VSPTPNVNKILLVNPYKKFGHHDFTVLQILSLTKYFSSKFQSKWETFVTNHVRMHTELCFNNWRLDS